MAAPWNTYRKVANVNEMIFSMIYYHSKHSVLDCYHALGIDFDSSYVNENYDDVVATTDELRSNHHSMIHHQESNYLDGDDDDVRRKK